MKRFKIDDITWNDLSMEQVFARIDTARSSVGQEYLKRILRETHLEEAQLRKRSERASWFSSSPDQRKLYQKFYQDLGKTKKLSLYDYIFRFHEIRPAGNAVHFLLICLLLAAIVLIFLKPVIGIIALVVMFAVNIGSYFRFKAEIESYFMCFKYIVRMLLTASRIVRSTPEDLPGGGHSLSELVQELKQDIGTLAPLKRGSWLLTNSVSGSLVDVVMDYVRMLFHVDIIKFNQMRRLAADHTDTIDHLFCTLGEIESDICISLFRDSLDGWCLPVFTDQIGVRAEGMYHPLTQQPVKNSLQVTRSVLLTGSNASGKSTFLKQLAINQIFAQTICTCLADRYETTFYKVLSSMALSDNILGNESYFIVEIKSLKRIFDAVSTDADGNNTADAVPVMCFIDEVLRGTNTKERVAASSQILRKLASSNTLCFAATHDIELTQLLDHDMDNYHFEEFVNGNDVEFDYRIRKGPATSRNAIRLMQAYGFDPEITDAANALVDQL